MFLYFNISDLDSFTFMPLQRFLYTDMYRNWIQDRFHQTKDQSLVIDPETEAKIYREKDQTFLPVWAPDHNGFNGILEFFYKLSYPNRRNGTEII